MKELNAKQKSFVDEYCVDKNATQAAIRAGYSEDTAYQSRIQQGLLEHKVTEVTRSDGSSRITEQVRVTPKGISKLATETAKQYS